MRIFLLLLMALTAIPDNIKAYYEPYSNVSSKDKPPYEPYNNVSIEDEAAFRFDFHSMPHARIQSPKRNRRVRHQGVTFDEGHALIDFRHYLNEDVSMNFSFGYEDVHIKWADRFRPHHDKFQNAIVGTSIGCSSVDDWDFSADFLMHMSIKTFQGRYIAYDFSTKGRYSYSEDIGFHLGAICFVGMHFTRVYPVLGLDYSISEKMRFSLVYPYEMSLSHKYTDDWTFETGFRTFFSRQRMTKNEHLKRGVIAYTSYGFQVGALYRIKEQVNASFHVGQAFKGRMRVSNRHDSKRHHYRLGPKIFFSVGLEAMF